MPISYCKVCLLACSGVRRTLEDALPTVRDAVVGQEADERKEAAVASADLVAVGLDDTRQTQNGVQCQAGFLK